MDINYKVSFKIFGSILCVLSASMLLPLIVGLIYKDYASSLAFAYTLVPSSILGLLLIKLTSVKSNKLKMRDGAFIVSVSWILCGLIGAIPFVITSSIPNFISAFFETCSGFSTTGATVIPDVEIIPKAVLFWRSFTHWLGGMGILVFTIALLPAIGVDGQQVAAAEVPGLSLSKIVPKLSDTARYLYLLYTALTLVETGLLMFGGMTFFDAICHSFSTLGTGGFGNYNDSIAHFNSLYIDIIITLFMMIAGMNFNLFFIAYRNGISTFFKDAEWRFYILIIGFTSILMSIILYVSGTYNSIISSIRYVLFQNVSILTTTGFSTADYMLWPVFCQVLLFILFFIGGSSSSTSGGPKVIRILVILKMIKKSIMVRLHPTVIAQIRVNNQILSGEILSNIANFFFAFLGLGMFGAFIVSFDGYDFITSLSASFSCLSNVGPGLNAIGPSSNCSIFSHTSHLTLSILMIAGRLEIFTLLMLLRKKFWKPFR